MKFLVDAQLPRRLSLWLASRGHDAIHTLDLPDGNRTSDQQLAEIADSTVSVVVTKDADFVSSHQLHGTPKRLLLISTGNITNAALETVWQRHETAIATALGEAGFVELGMDRVIVHA